jgi:glycosyltransferase involved in cell wall biosynthesis
MRTIFVSIASYRDDELQRTVNSLYHSAENPDALTIGIVNQQARGKHDDFSWLGDQVKVDNVHYRFSKGAGWARKRAMSLYDGEDFFFQIDSHMLFEPDWDKKLIAMYDWCAKDAGTDKVILSQFAAPYEVFTDGSLNFPEGDDKYWDGPSWTSVVNTWAATWAGNREKMEDLTHPHPTHTVLAAILFTTGDFVKDIPYDDRISFMGEELCIALRAYTRGYQMYAPNEMIAYHHYKREDQPKIWRDNIQGERAWSEIEMNSQQVQRRVLLGEDEGIFGIGDYQKYLDYQKMVGIDFKTFYSEEIDRKVNMALITTDTIFDEDFNMIEISMSGYCTNGLHSQCLAYDHCDCDCHEGDRSVK